MRNDRRLWALKNRHADQDAVIIGMGPSLKTDDLKRFEKYVSFACNKIFLSYDELDWRPDYYSVSDFLVAENNRKQIAGIKEAQKIFPASLRDELAPMEDAIFTKCHRHMRRFTGDPRYFDDPIKGIVDGGATVALYMIQLAYWMGCRNVYVVGVDFSFQLSPEAREVTRVGEKVLVNQEEVNHFHKDYRQPGEKWSEPKMDVMAKGFAYAAAAFKRDGRRLFNASRKTELEALERVDFDAVFPEIEEA